MTRGLANFDEDNIGSCDSEEHVREAAATLSPKYKRVEGDFPGSHTIDHGVQIHAFDPQRRLRLIIRTRIEPEYMAKDIVQLLSGCWKNAELV
ncbi:hypothetical protein [Burkholderia diffusa]|uniref:hypothetical protein n=1 Tax=Burkholderia diffusa TaxID=488732 RepID=UPI00157AE70F|nr:hypothetical protein [Burkholderia diffusa]NTY38191.1 hypothetical protein [Burkholderia diffusa]